jgi:hypothetical protein
MTNVWLTADAGESTVDEVDALGIEWLLSIQGVPGPAKSASCDTAGSGTGDEDDDDEDDDIDHSNGSDSRPAAASTCFKLPWGMLEAASRGIEVGDDRAGVTISRDD